MGNVVFEDLDGVAGYYDHEGGMILVERSQSKAAAASTIAHELVHSILGDKRNPSESRAEENRRELAADRLAARIRIPFGALVEAYTRLSGTADRLRYLHCDEDELMARIFGLTAEEQFLFEVCVRRCVGVGSKKSRRGYPVPIAHRSAQKLVK